MVLRDWRRYRVLWALLLVVLAVFFWLSDAITHDGPTRLRLLEHGHRVTEAFNPADIHAGTMTPIAIGSLAALAGLFVAVDARAGDQRLVLAGVRAGVVLVARLAVIGLAGMLATAVSLAVAAAVFDARQWAVYAAANLLIAITYGLVGVLIGSVFGRVSGVFIAFLVPFLDLGIAQSPMQRADPAAWAASCQALAAYASCSTAASRRPSTRPARCSSPPCGWSGSPSPPPRLPGLPLGVRAIQAAGHRADTGSEIGPMRDGVLWYHARHVLSEVTPPARGGLVGDPGCGCGQHQPSGQYPHSDQSS